MNCGLDLEGYEDIKTGEPSGIKLPYIVTMKVVKVCYLFIVSTMRATH